MANEIMAMQIRQLKDTAEAMGNLYQEMNNMAEKYDRIHLETSQQLEEIKERQNDLDRHITLTEGETYKLSNAVNIKAVSLTAAFFKYQGLDDELFRQKMGHTRSYIWILLKNYFGVRRYPLIPHIEFENAMRKVEEITIYSFPKAYYRLTPNMYTHRDGAPIDHVEFEDKIKQHKLFHLD
ncbi:ORF6C domain-containing protein [Aerococcus sp. UMB8608]|uniref:ORF6C domain-containing protein n=1 Tax=Aerococcus sanguinicola TaxID=119206 RepID=A0A0X8F9M2_9LACT|nr:MULTISPECIES: ORF6C domain-containing protein [Aerococcus]AMB93282.1 hypothetical protein AWM72_00100 [Aerococcus sanguinicola]MDK6679381.1 ORF6C domain-containing protein [Aerococcus sp. UMB8608]MDK6685777.1 ORF6C domain-containing protein [Aerococcus sp. UMB8623]